MSNPTPAVQRAAREYASLDPNDPWPTNAELGGSLTGTRDDEYRAACEDSARDILAAALHVEEIARALFTWNTPQNPYFVIHGRPDGTDEAGQTEDSYLPIAHALHTSILGETP